MASKYSVVPNNKAVSAKEVEGALIVIVDKALAKRTVYRVNGIEYTGGATVDYAKLRRDYREEFVAKLRRTFGDENIDEDAVNRIAVFLNSSAYNKKAENGVRIGQIYYSLKEFGERMGIAKGYKEMNRDVITIKKISKILFPEYLAYMRGASDEEREFILKFHFDDAPILGTMNGFLAVPTELRSKWLQALMDHINTWKDRNKRFEEEARLFFSSNPEPAFIFAV
jgi:hypothetical protein